MSDNSAIEWTDATWNPIRARNRKTGKIGWFCVHKSPACENCYAEGFNLRLGNGVGFRAQDLAQVEIFLDEKMLTLPLRWKRPRKIFVCSMTDLFAEFIPDEMIDTLFAVMALCPQHTFQVLTKRPGRMKKWCSSDRADVVGLAMLTIVDRIPYGHRCVPWPLPNVWLGTSVEDQLRADERIPHLIATPAAKRFLSVEPLLGEVSLRWLSGPDYNAALARGATITEFTGLKGINWVIVGGESGPGARPMHPNWARTLRDECQAAGISYFFKQWGEWAPTGDMPSETQEHYDVQGKTSANLVRVGKKAAGRLLDGIEHNGYPA